MVSETLTSDAEYLIVFLGPARNETIDEEGRSETQECKSLKGREAT